jgi:hypothetical protein
MLEKLQDSRPATQIVNDLAAHFAANQPLQDRDQIIELFMQAFAQDPMISTTPVTDDDAPEDTVNDDGATS